LTEIGSKQGTSDMTWIGFRYVQNKWSWTDASDASYVHWMKGRPEKDTNKYACAQDRLGKDGLLDDHEILQDDYKGSKTQWNDVECSTKMRKYVCKKAAKF
ncbi:hypothetical protein TELCIR_10990, partial [Teladorsagia circumcincta]